MLENGLHRSMEIIERRYPYIYAYADSLVELIPSERGVSRFLRGLVSLRLVTGKKFFSVLTIATLGSAVARGFSVDTLVNERNKFTSADDVNKGALTLAQAGRESRRTQGKALSTGWFHGHIRLLQPGSLLAIVLAGEQVDALFVGLERNWRTREYKHAEPVLTDRRRENILVRWPGLGLPVSIQRLDYSDVGYERALRTVHPTIYFGQEGNPPVVRREMARRAKAVGVEYRELPYIDSFSTTDYLSLIPKPVDTVSEAKKLAINRSHR